MTDKQRQYLQKRLQSLLQQIKAEGPVEYLMTDYSHTHNALMQDAE